jgi:putative transposase
MVNAKRVYRLYDQENLTVRSVERKKIGRRQRVPQGPATGPNQCWSADFVSDKLTDGRLYQSDKGLFCSTQLRAASPHMGRAMKYP